MSVDCICVAEDGVFACALVFPSTSGHSRGSYSWICVGKAIFSILIWLKHETCPWSADDCLTFSHRCSAVYHRAVLWKKRVNSISQWEIRSSDCINVRHILPHIFCNQFYFLLGHARHSNSDKLLVPCPPFSFVYIFFHQFYRIPSTYRIALFE